VQIDLQDDGWDWPWILFIGMKELGMSHEATLKCTPKKFFALMDCALKYADTSSEDKKKDKKASKAKSGYIDDIVW
jgi:hypothetical protein